jgi:exodeoxyribonuclease V beta subunit
MTQILSVKDLPFSGLQVIEASAGTGKTWTLSALYVRLVLGHGLPQEFSGGLNPPDILVMTFTEMATAELRSKIRDRLSRAAQYFQKPVDALTDDPFLEEIKQSYESSLWPNCAAKLNLAAQWMDEAAIFTIHAWSARMLKEFV